METARTLFAGSLSEKCFGDDHVRVLSGILKLWREAVKENPSYSSLHNLNWFIVKPRRTPMFDWAPVSFLFFRFTNISLLIALLV